MAENDRLPTDGCTMQIEPRDRLVVLARALRGPGLEGDCEGAVDPSDSGETSLGRALYRHRAVYRSACDAPVWSHLELRYFRDVVPAHLLQDLVFARQPADVRLLRAEILLTTPSSFIMPRGWRGTADRPERQASLEYIHVRPDRLGAYRDVMQRYVGPAAARLVAAEEVGTFRAMETAAVLHRDPSFDVEWNQIHLCEVKAEGFEGFGPAFDAALRDIAPNGGYAGVFAGLDDLRTIPRWTFNDAVVEADLALARLGSEAVKQSKKAQIPH